jgi:hypothetical protein
VAGEKRNAGVSPNTYYQCILHLRKSLAAIGCLDVIDTVPRHGLRFNNRLKVTYLYPEKNNEQQTDNNINQDMEGCVHGDIVGIVIDRSERVEADDVESDDSETRHKRPIFLKVQQQKGGFMKVASGILSG